MKASYLTNICVLFSQGWVLWLTELNEACYLFSQGLQSEKIKIKGSTWAKGQRAPEAASTCFRNVVDKNTAYRPTYIFTGLGGVREAAWVKATCPPGPEPRQGAGATQREGWMPAPWEGAPQQACLARRPHLADTQNTSPFSIHVCRS